MSYFANVADPRIARSRLYPLSSILMLSLCAIVCGAESFVGIEEFALGKEAWLKTFLGASRSAAQSMAGQRAQWKRVMSLPMK